MASVAPLLLWERSDIEEPDESRLVTEDDTPLDGILTEKQERLLTEPVYTSWSGPLPGEDGAPRPFAVLANVGLFSTPEEQPVVPDVMLSLDVSIPPALEEKRMDASSERFNTGSNTCVSANCAVTFTCITRHQVGTS